MSVTIEKPCWGFCPGYKSPVVIRKSDDSAYPWLVEAKNGHRWTVNSKGHEYRDSGSYQGRCITRILTGPEYPPHIPFDTAEWPPAPVYCEWQGPGRYVDQFGEAHTWIKKNWMLNADGSTEFFVNKDWRMVRFDKSLKELLEA